MRFDHPSAITVDSSGNAYVVDGTGFGKYPRRNRYDAARTVGNQGGRRQRERDLYLVSNDSIEATPAGSDWAVATLAGLAEVVGAPTGRVAPHDLMERAVWP
jgi:hypothetical protein